MATRCRERFKVWYDVDGNQKTGYAYVPCATPGDPDGVDCEAVGYYRYDKTGKPISTVDWRPVEKAKPTTTRSNATVRTNAAKLNGVTLDPARLAFAFPDGVPGGDPRISEILKDPGLYTEIWERLSYILTGVKTYNSPTDDAMDAMLKRICE